MITNIPDPRLLRGKRAFVTGASSGLGAHFAGILAAAGAHVILAARRIEALEAVSQRIARAGGEVQAVQLDVADPRSRAAALELIGQVDVLVNNAGVVHEAPALEQTEADWDRVLDTNLKGMFFIAQAIAKSMKDRGGGSIINIASILGLRQGAGVLPYAVSKAGTIQMTQVLALEWARHGIRVNAIAPGYIATELNGPFWDTPAGAALVKRIPQRRLGQPADLDGILLLLASDASAYMTGSVIAVDGGHLVSSL